MNEQANPELASMYVKLTNPANECLKKEGSFDLRPFGDGWVGGWQYINSEQLTLIPQAGDSETYSYDANGYPLERRGLHSHVPDAVEG